MGEHWVGREAETAQLRDALADTDDTAVTGVVVHGEAGVGKSALVGRVLADTPHLTGGALATLSWAPYLVWRRALAARIAEADWEGDPEYVAGVVTRAVGDELVVLEDLQWADPQSRQVVTMVAGRVRLVATVRRGDRSAAEVLAELTDAGLTRIDLAPLAEHHAAELARLLRPGSGQARVEQVVARAGGNPLLLEELARTDAEPESLRLALLARVRPLSQSARSGLALLAVADRPLPASDVPAVDDLVEAGLVEISAERVAIRHGLLAEVVRAELSAERAVEAHRVLAELVQHPGDAARHHLAAGNPAAARAAALAAVEAAGTPGERAAHLVTAALSSSGADGEALRIQAARALCDAFEVERAAELLAELPDVPELRAAAELARGQVTYAQGDYEGWRRSANAAVAAAAPDSAEAVEAAIEQAAVRLFLDDDPGGALPLAEAALADAGRVGRHVAYATNIVAASRYFLQDDSALDLFADSLAAARAEGNLQVERSAANNLISGHEAFGSPQLARSLAAEMVARGEELRLGGWRSHFGYWDLNLAMHAGDHAAVLEQAPPILERAPLLNTRQELGAALAASQLQTGRFREALATAATHLGGSAGRALGNLHWTRASALLMAGEPEKALAEREGFLEGNVDPHNVTMSAPTFAWAAHEAGAALPPEPPHRVDRGILAGVTPELEGLALLGEDRPGDAADRFAAAATSYAGFDLLRELWSQWAQGESLRLAGDAGGATPVLQEVEERAESHGMAPMVARARRSLRALGVRRVGTGARRPGTAGLSDREAEVVALVGEGLSDREIAARLGLSPRTVASQVESARRKLGAATRRQLGAVAESG